MNSLTVFVLSVVYIALQKIEGVHGSDSGAQLTISNPSNDYAYGDKSYIFTCELPSSNQIGNNHYEIIWLYKGPGDSMAMPMLGNGDVFNDQNERIIDGTIEKSNSNNKITTTLTIGAIDPDAAGEYNCVIRWGRVYLSSTAVILKVRAISSPPKTTNAPKGAEAKFTCKATGDSAATITFHKKTDHVSVGPVVVTSATSGSTVTTTGVLTLSGVTAADHGIEYYCKAAWGAKEVKSDNVYLSVLDMEGLTTPVWGVVGNVAEFHCKSAVLLKANPAGDAYLVNGEKVYAATQISWEVYDTSDSSWKSSDTNNRLTVKPSMTSEAGIKVSPLLIGNIQSTDDGLKVRCNIAYQADANNNVFGGTITSGGLELKIGSITSFTASNSGPIVGDTITLTCVATGASAPTFSLTTDGTSTFNNEFLTTPEEIGSSVGADGTTHTVKYKTRSEKPNVLISGQKIDCRADYGSGQESQKQLTVTNYYKCSSVKINSYNDDDNGATVEQTDLGDGSLKQTITCPADTNYAKYYLETDKNSAAEITCTKETGKYNPSHLARCQKQTPIGTGSGSNTMIVPTNYAQPCSTEEDNKDSEYSTRIMKQKLNSMTDTVCGFRLRIKCLMEDKCTLDKEKSGCSYDPATRKLKNEYHVIFKDPKPWSIDEQSDLLQRTGGKIQFWGCSETYS